MLSYNIVKNFSMSVGYFETQNEIEDHIESGADRTEVSSSMCKNRPTLCQMECGQKGLDI